MRPTNSAMMEARPPMNEVKKVPTRRGVLRSILSPPVRQQAMKKSGFVQYVTTKCLFLSLDGQNIKNPRRVANAAVMRRAYQSSLTTTRQAHTNWGQCM